MSHADRISSLEEELTRAKKDAEPVIVELVPEDRDQRTTFDKTRGTTQVDLLGGESQQYHERPLVKEAVTLEKEIDPTVGKVVSEDERQRVIKLTGSGTIRTDNR
ncbi:MAG: hypothetical protein H8K07_20495 [Nitrospira sp.]|jgi:hypothetical protein|nr:hypothetical protein [Nitrospira sp.]MDI3465628.1 hypothetical protein [Nitrospira sp.]